MRSTGWPDEDADMTLRGRPDSVRGALPDANRVCETVERTAVLHGAVLPPPERKVS